jgi:hypothetical protein
MGNTVWVCLACGRYDSDRYRLGDVSCFLNSQQFDMDGITWDEDQPMRIKAIDMDYIVKDTPDESA